jgi:predicted membrane-bound dolichyl-phosphate-mannose-protein mannosyltransferase
MIAIERIFAAAALFVAAHFAMGFINSSAGGSGGSLLFPFATDAPTHWAFGSLDGMLGLLSPVMIALAGIAVLTFFLAFFSSLGLFVPADLWRPLVLVGVVGSVALLVLHPSVYAALPLALNAGLAWVAWTSAWTPAAG